MAPKKSLLSKSPSTTDTKAEAEQSFEKPTDDSKGPGYVVELAKSGRAKCKKCDDAIGLKTIRIGVMLEGEWGLFTSWQHLECTIFHKSCDSVEKIEGYNLMKESDQAEIFKRWQESKDEVDEDMTDINPNEMVRSAWKYPAEPSSDLLMPLLPYQKEGLGWMLSQEGIKVPRADEAGHISHQITFGGILADEMGMGKTIQAISLMLTNRPSLKDPETSHRWDQSDVSHEFKGSSHERGGTLLVLPTVAIRQWQTEISRFTREGSLTVKVYHGSDRSTAVSDLLKYDVVITSYKVLEMEYRKETAGVKVECRICGKRFYPEKLRVHRKYFCGETAQRTAAQSKTEKKRVRSGATNSFNEDSGSDEDDEDEISKQKKANKNASSAKSTKTMDASSEDEILNQKKQNKKSLQNSNSLNKITASSKKGTSSVKSSSKKATSSTKKPTQTLSGSISDHSTSSEDEIARQKLENKKRNVEKNLPKRGSKVASAAKKAAIEDLSTSSEDEIARQKLENKRRAAEQANEIKTPSTTSRKRSISSTVSKAASISSSAKKRIRRNDNIIDHVDEESEDFGTNDDSKTPAKNLNQMLSFDSSDESAPINSKTVSRTSSASKTRLTATPIASSTKHNTPHKSKVMQSGIDHHDVSKEESILVEDIFKSPYRRPQRAAAIASAQKNTMLLSGSKVNDEEDDDEEEEDEMVSDAVVSESDISGKSSSEVMDISDDEKKTALSRKQKPSPVVQRNKSSLPSMKSKSVKKTPSKLVTSSRTHQNSKTKSAQKRKKNVDEDDEYFHDEEEEESNDDDDDSLVDESVDEDDSASSPKKAKSSSLKANKNSTTEKVRKKSSNSKMDTVDEEVENDIQDAIKAHMKASRNATTVKSLLHRISWFRIILDEAHMIKDRSTSTCKAVFNLVSLHKWCLTGTPLQNRVGELYSLIRFLRIDPHAYYFCRHKGCECKSLHYRFTNSRCDDCEHSVIQHFCHFNRNILNPIQRCGFVNEGRRAMMKLKHQILDHILLRRTKTTRADDIQLPMRIVQVRQERMDEKEEDFYQALYTQSQAQFNTYLMAGTVLNNYAHIFDILIRLRQAVDHPYLVIYSDSQGNNTAVTAAVAAADEANQSRKAALLQGTGDDDSNSLICGLCQDPVEDAVMTACKHVFCRACIMDFVSTVSSSSTVNGGNLCCPDCNESLTLQLGNNENSNSNNGTLAPSNNMHNSIWNDSKRRRKSILDKIDLRSFQTSTKMEALMEELYRMGEEDVGSKAIVFSQFVNMLDLLEYRIQVGGIGCVKLSGSMTVEQRDKIITTFKEDPSIRVLLISLKAGGVALNLTVASRIFLMDPWWNPAAEMQAIDRTHRIGQYKSIFATRFIIEDSIEERILKLQDKKKLVFDGTVGGDAGSMTKLTVDDMRFLFQ